MKKYREKETNTWNYCYFIPRIISLAFKKYNKRNQEGRAEFFLIFINPCDIVVWIHSFDV